MNWIKNSNIETLEEREKKLFSEFSGTKVNSCDYVIRGMEDAVRLIYKHLNKKIRVVTDYDVDGVTSASSLKIGLDGLFAKDVEFYIPKRETDGYGLSVKIVENFLPKLKEGEEALLITADNGIAAHEAVSKAKDLGWTVLILDHHLPVKDDNENIILPNADVIIDPHAIEGQADFLDYCGAGLVYKLFQSIPEISCDDKTMAKINSFAMLGTIGDSVKFIEERDGHYYYDNYIIVRNGLNSIIQNEGRTVGLYCLLRMLQMEYNVTSSNVAYVIAPTINAIGRLEDNGATKAFRLLSADKDFTLCDKMAEELKNANQDRKDSTQKIIPILKERIQAEGKENDYPIVVCGLPGEIKTGLLGLIAGNLAECYNSMIIVLSPTDNGVLKGSARAPKNAPKSTNIKAVLDECSEYLLEYGGHASAAGLALHESNLCKFADKVLKITGEKPDELYNRYYDFEIALSDISRELEIIKKYEPFGAGHTAPVYKVNYTCELNKGQRYNILGAGKKTLKFTNKYADAINFTGEGIAKYLEMETPEKVVLYGALGTNVWQGKSHPQIQFNDIEKES